MGGLRIRIGTPIKALQLPPTAAVGLPHVVFSRPLTRLGVPTPAVPEDKPLRFQPTTIAPGSIRAWAARTPSRGIPAITPAPQALALQSALSVFEADIGSHTTKFAEIYKTRPVKFWTILALMTMGLPEAWVANKILKYEADTHTEKIMTDFMDAKTDKGIRQVVDYVLEHGVSTYLAQTNALPDDIVAKAAQMDRAIRGARYMLDTIASDGENAIAAGQTLGLEVEYLYRTALGLTGLKDPVYEALKAAFEAQGHTVELQTGATSFVFPDKPSYFPAIRGRYTYNGQTLRHEILMGTGAIIVSAIPEWAEERATTIHAKGSRDVFEARSDMRKEVARHFGIPVRDVQALEGNPETYSETYIVMVKAKDNDILKMHVAIDKPQGKATLTLINGVFADTTNALTIPAKSLSDVIDHVKKTFAGQAMANKVDTYSALKLTTPDGHTHVLTLTDECDPFSEFVSSILRHKDFHLMDTVLNTLKSLGAKGTSPTRQIGVHIHMGLPMKDADKRYTIAPVLGVLREYAQHAHDLLAILPSNPNRQAFIQPIGPKLAQRLMDPNYVKDPTELATILRVMADIAGILSKKYSALNLDNHVALMIQEMIEDGTIKSGQVITTSWKNEDYQFRVIAGESRESYNIIREFENRAPVHLMRVASPQVRKPTAELRIFDTVIDAPTIRFWLNFMEAWGWRHGTHILASTGGSHG